MSLANCRRTYWRPGPGHLWHCYVKLRKGRYESLCARLEIAGRGAIGGAYCRRPICVLRCVRCDLVEIEYLRSGESLPPSKRS